MDPQPTPQPEPNVQPRLAPQLEQARDALVDANQRVVSFIRQHPGACLLGALAVGYLVGKWASRR